jgi:hypothetical protein
LPPADPESLRPGEVCRRLLNALDASDGRRRKRKRNTNPDAIGMGIKRDLLDAAVREDPAPEDFEAWLLRRCLAAGAGGGAVRAMAIEVLEEWRMAQAVGNFASWLALGAPSEDVDD